MNYSVQFSSVPFLSESSANPSQKTASGHAQEPSRASVRMLEKCLSTKISLIAFRMLSESFLITSLMFRQFRALWTLFSSLLCLCLSRPSEGTAGVSQRRNVPRPAPPWIGSGPTPDLSRVQKRQNSGKRNTSGTFRSYIFRWGVGGLQQPCSSPAAALQQPSFGTNRNEMKPIGLPFRFCNFDSAIAIP